MEAPAPQPPVRRQGQWWRGLLFIMLTLVAMIVYHLESDETNWVRTGRNQHDHLTTTTTSSRSGKDGIHTKTREFPEILLETVYDRQHDFKNEKGIVPSFWENQQEEEQDSNKTMSTLQQQQGVVTWGPCYPPNHVVDWNKEMKRNDTDYHAIPSSQKSSHLSSEDDLSDYCRPGFLIIGTGKSGTSSLYHYLTSHDRVLPASQKQIHYFKYPIKWYLSHFPTATSFLASGALMTGEASPGYLPYPNVAARTAQLMPGTKIVVIGRNPLERAYSSYRYNYVDPSTDLMKRGGVHGIPKGQSKDYYQENYLFSFEEMLNAEYIVLQECLAFNGTGPIKTEKTIYNKLPWARDEYKRRQQRGLPPLIDLDGTCYGTKVSATVPRKQWTTLLSHFPKKFVHVSNLFLVQALLGRSLYVFPLEWWYLTFFKNNVYFVCTEEIKDRSGEPMNALSQFLGLPNFNFSSTVSEGMFNVGGHKGYDEQVSWEEVEKEEEEETTKHYESTSSNETETEIPLSEEFRKELEDFIRPFNERLFALVGRRCNW